MTTNLIKRLTFATLMLFAGSCNASGDVRALSDVKKNASMAGIVTVSGRLDLKLYDGFQSNAPQYLYQYSIDVEKELVGDAPESFCSFSELDVGQRYLIFLSPADVIADLHDDWLLKHVPVSQRTFPERVDCKYTPTLGPPGEHRIVTFNSAEFVILNDASLSACWPQLPDSNTSWFEAVDTLLQANLRFAVGLSYVMDVVEHKETQAECEWGFIYSSSLGSE